jgi:hypothetical protein
LGDICKLSIGLLETSIVDCEQFVQPRTGFFGPIAIPEANSADPAQATEAMGGTWKIHFCFETLGLERIGECQICAGTVRQLRPQLAIGHPLFQFV